MYTVFYIFYVVEASNSGIVSSYSVRKYSVLLKAEGVLGKESISSHRLDKVVGAKERALQYVLGTYEGVRRVLP